MFLEFSKVLSGFVLFVLFFDFLGFLLAMLFFCFFFIGCFFGGGVVIFEGQSLDGVYSFLVVITNIVALRVY